MSNTISEKQILLNPIEINSPAASGPVASKSGQHQANNLNKSSNYYGTAMKVGLLFLVHLLSHMGPKCVVLQRM